MVVSLFLGLVRDPGFLEQIPPHRRADNVLADVMDLEKLAEPGTVVVKPGLGVAKPEGGHIHISAESE